MLRECEEEEIVSDEEGLFVFEVKLYRGSMIISALHLNGPCITLTDAFY